MSRGFIAALDHGNVARLGHLIGRAHMRGLSQLLAFVMALTALGIPRLHAVDRELPWAFKGTPAEGYSIDLVSVEPTAGTPLPAGKPVDFKVTVSYTMSVADRGAVILVFQDEKNRSADPDRPQVSQAVTGASGTVTLAATVTVPKRAKELRVFIPLVPNGLTTTNGEVTLRYPIEKKPS
jgi:hypothetical protein